MQEALRKIYDVTSDTLTIKIPPNISYPKKAEVIVLFLENKIDPIPQADPWKATRQFREKLEQSGRVFSDSVELIREDRER
ncbi:hypothetical protein QUF54_01365 [Candidatus Marithioploca araucensis]|uniref:DUF104 domain-containing protein n=1 Tax=Candidatus Marithioploca araucensis TaxID=70273 RepID=A0ABT7VQP9_9GAMM|nr:hypothetical protein [Candidatus Marithioploca araucensis]